jgi:hypothetical protein
MFETVVFDNKVKESRVKYVLQAFATVRTRTWFPKATLSAFVALTLAKRVYMAPKAS